MSNQPQEHFIHWLRDAYAMKKHALEMCERQFKRLDEYPDIKARISTHIEETKNQITKLDRCFDILKENPSRIKAATGSVMGNLQGLSGIFIPDEVVKGAMASYVFEQMEIASYTVLIRTAEICNQPEIAAICREIREEEIAMAAWLSEHMPSTVEHFLFMDTPDEKARA